MLRTLTVRVGTTYYPAVEQATRQRSGYDYALKTQVGAVCVALITAGAFIAVPIPVSPVPIVLQNMFVVFTGLLLTPSWAFVTVSVYLLLGAAGLPILAGAAGGLAHFAGPTGGFLLGYPVAACVTALIMRTGNAGTGAVDQAGTARLVLAIACGFTAIYVPGIPRLAAVTDLTITEALPIGLIPFIPGDVVKAIALFILVKTLPSSLWRSWT